jgi:hypothetical protein
MPSSKTGGGATAIARSSYVLELARGCSHISSALTPDTCSRAIDEVLGEFRKLYGYQELALFKKLLVEDLQRRGKWDAASAVDDFNCIG